MKSVIFNTNYMHWSELVTEALESGAESNQVYDLYRIDFIDSEDQNRIGADPVDDNTYFFFSKEEADNAWELVKKEQHLAATYMETSFLLDDDENLEFGLDLYIDRQGKTELLNA